MRKAIPGHVDVWRVPLASHRPGEADWAILSVSERERASRFHFERDSSAFVVSHVAVRRILSRYIGEPPERLSFATGPAGKPYLDGPFASGVLEFNLSHSGELALVAVGRTALGVDVERWDSTIELLELAEHFFSRNERLELRALVHDPRSLTAGFFNAWTRKEAYLKATGQGVTPGLHHFDVVLTPGERPALVQDRSDPAAVDRWVVHDLQIDEGYSAALVSEAPVHGVLMLEYS